MISHKGRIALPGAGLVAALGLLAGVGRLIRRHEG